MDTGTVHCKATIGKRAGAYGFEPVGCGQSVGLVTMFGADGTAHYACSLPGHRASVVRRFGEAVAADYLESRCHLSDGRCLTHDCPDTTAHHFDQPRYQGHSALEFAMND